MIALALPSPANLNEVAAALDLSGMASKTFTTIEMQAGMVWKNQFAKEIIKKARKN